jgi:PilZ domain-containing protein
VQTEQERPIYGRRSSYRLETPKDVWVYWRTGGIDDVSRVRDLSAGGLFLATPTERPEGTKVKIDFLVQEGRIRTEAVVRRKESPNGLGLKFTAITEEDCPRLVALIDRMRDSSIS